MKSCCWIIAVVIGLIACSSDDMKPKLPVDGAWVISEVHYDGEEQPNWEGIDFTFEQTSDSAGYYYLPLTPYDSIWQSSGSWKLSSATLIKFDDKINAGFEADNTELELITYLPWTARSTCYGDICLPVVTGNWYFRLKRK